MEKKNVRRRTSRKKKRRQKAYAARFFTLIMILAVLALLIFGAVKLVSFVGGMLPDDTKSAEEDSEVSNIISIEKDGSLTETSVEDFDTSEYDADELKKMVNDTIADYNGSGEEKISLKSLDIKDGKARAVISYKTAADYAAYNVKTFEIGDVKDLDITGVTLADDKNTVLTHDEVEKVKGHYVLLNDNTRVSVPKNIQYVSRNVKKSGKKTADVKKAGIDSVIIYK